MFVLVAISGGDDIGIGTWYILEVFVDDDKNSEGDGYHLKHL